MTPRTFSCDLMGMLNMMGAEMNDSEREGLSTFSTRSSVAVSVTRNG